MRCFLLTFSLLFTFSYAQDLTGKWVIVNALSQGYYAELELIQNNDNNYGGHAYDVEAGGYCRHWLEAKFNSETKQFSGADVELINKTPDHAATDYILRYEKIDGREYLVGYQPTFQLEYRKLYGKRLDLYNSSPLEFSREVRYIKVEEKYDIYKPGDPAMMSLLEIELEKSKYPESIEEESAIVFEDEVYIELPEFDSIQPQTDPEIAEKEAEIIPDLFPDIFEKKETKIDSTKIEKSQEPEVVIIPEITPPPPPKTENEILTDRKNQREDIVVSNIPLKSEKFTVLIRDYGTEDNDTVTIFYNDKIIRKNLRITNKAEEIELELEPNIEVNKLVFVANNLGDIPPNTARVFIIDPKGNRTVQELFSDEKNNAVIELVATKEN